VNHHTFGYHLAVIPDDAAGRPLSPTELATIAELEQRLLDAPAPAQVRGHRRRRRGWRRSANTVPLAALLGAGVVLVAVAVLGGAGLLGTAAVLMSVVVTAFAWLLVPPRLGGPLLPRRPLRFLKLKRPR
jgi:peptidoglycan/LPS O-acetylase OafA/YrhL